MIDISDVCAKCYKMPLWKRTNATDFLNNITEKSTDEVIMVTLLHYGT